MGIVFILFFFLFLPFQKVNASLLFREGLVREGARFVRNFGRLVPSEFRQPDLSALQRFKAPIVSYSQKGRSSEDTFYSSTLWILGACGFSSLMMSNNRTEGHDPKFEEMLLEGSRALQNLESQSKEKEIVFLVGCTGEGKTFITKRLTGKTVREIKSKEVSTFKSDTFYPQSFCENSLSFCDVPGYEDRTRGPNYKMLSPILLRGALKIGGNSARLALVIDFDRRIRINRGGGVVQVFDQELFLLFKEDVFEKGMFYILNDNQGKKQPTGLEIETSLKDLIAAEEKELEMLKKELNDVSNRKILPSDGIRQEKLRSIDVRKFRLKGLRSMSSNFVDFNAIDPEGVLQHLKSLKPFSLDRNLKDFPSDIAKLINIQTEESALVLSIKKKTDKIESAKLLQSGDVEKINGFRKKCEDDLASVLKELEELEKELKGSSFRLVTLCERRAWYNPFRWFWGPDAPYTKPDQEPFRHGIVVWIDGKAHFIDQEMRAGDNPLRLVKSDPANGTLKVRYTGNFGENHHVVIGIETLEASPGSLFRDAKREETLLETKKLLERNIKEVGLGKAVITEKELEKLSKEKKLLEDELKERKAVFDAANWLIGTLFNVKGRSTKS